jgi:hypothetical protein
MRELERLAHVCDPAEIHDSLNVFVETACGEQDDRGGRRLRLSAKLTTDRQPAQTRHHHVADDRIRKPTLDHDLEGLHTVLRTANVEPVAGEPQLEKTAERVVILCDENARWVAVRHMPVLFLERWFDCDWLYAGRHLRLGVQQACHSHL